MIVSTRVVFDLAYIGTCFWIVANVPAEPVAMEPVKIFLVSSGIAMIAGMASLTRNKAVEKLTPRVIASHVLNMGTCGAAISMILYAMLHPRNNLEWWIIGTVGIFSLGGLTSIEWVVEFGRSLIEKFSKEKQ